MKSNKKIVIIALIAAFLFVGKADSLADTHKIREAKQFINKFEALSHSYDEKIVDMYAEDARIIRFLEHKNGKVEKIILPTQKYKSFLKFAKYFAQLSGYKNYYKNLEFKPEGKKVRIIGKRENDKGYIAPVSILVGETPNGDWKIFEEITGTKSVFLIKKIL